MHTYQKAIKRRIMAYPDKYRQCGDCQKIFCLFRPGGGKDFQFKGRPTRTNCPYCTSTKFLDVTPATLRK